MTVSRTNTGIVGVRLNKKLNRYEVSWANIDGSPGKASVSINKYGKKEAFKKACEIRKSKDQIRLDNRKLRVVR